MYVKNCEFCGDRFITKSDRKKFCSNYCKRAKRMQKLFENEQLCWNCKKACGGCLWSDKDLPVPGWEAEATIVKDSEGDFTSYEIKKCPEFIRG